MKIWNKWVPLSEATLRYETGGGGFISAVDGVQGGLTIAIGVLIEDATSGNGNDSLFGNDSKNTLIANAGNDVLVGYAGNDTVLSGAGSDVLNGVKRIYEVWKPSLPASLIYPYTFLLLSSNFKGTKGNLYLDFNLQFSINIIEEKALIYQEKPHVTSTKIPRISVLLHKRINCFCGKPIAPS